jgi:two-component system sensor histidine kinase AlgZ
VALIFQIWQQDKRKLALTNQIGIMKKIGKQFKQFFFKIEQRVPYIPDFSDVWNSVKVLVVSFMLCVIYSFTQVQKSSEFYLKFVPTLQNFAPYVFTQLFLLIITARIINKLKAVWAIFFIAFLNFICVFSVHAILIKSLIISNFDVDNALPQFFVGFGILFLFLIYFDWREKNLDPANTLAKLTFLQSKMQPHFLFNTLSSIMGLIKKEPDVARKMLLNLSELLRVSIKEEDVAFLYPLKDEVSLCEKYLEIEKTRLGSRLKVIWQKDAAVMDAKVPKLFIQPLIENSILHGIQYLEEGGIIEINLNKNANDRLVIELKNPVPNQLKAELYQNKDSNNVSLNNLKERLELYYNGQIVFKRKNRKGTFTVYIEVPFITEP